MTAQLKRPMHKPALSLSSTSTHRELYSREPRGTDCFIISGDVSDLGHGPLLTTRRFIHHGAGAPRQKTNDVIGSAVVPRNILELFLLETGRLCNQVSSFTATDHRYNSFPKGRST